MEAKDDVRIQLEQFLAQLPRRADGQPRLSSDHLAWALGLAGVRQVTYQARRDRGQGVLDALAPRRRRA